MSQKRWPVRAKPSAGKRVFFALLPDTETVAAIEHNAAQYSPLTGRKVDPANYHITFFSEILTSEPWTL